MGIKRGKIVGFISVVALLLGLLPGVAMAGVSGEWGVSPINVVIEQGDSVDRIVTLTANKDLGDIRFDVVPELQPYVSVSPEVVANVAAGDLVVVTLSVTATFDSPVGTFAGTLKAKAEKKTLAKPLPLSVTIIEPTLPDDTGSSVIGTSGGVVATSSGAASVEIPEGALSSATTITIESGAATPPAELGQSVSDSYDFGPDGMVFDRVIEVTLAYDDVLLNGADPSDLVVLYQQDGIWRSAPSVVDVSSKTVTALAMHFTKFALVKPALPFEYGSPTVDPGSGASGTLFGLSASGFAAAAEAEIVVIHPDNSYTVMPVTADGSGVVVEDIDSAGYVDGVREAWVQAMKGPGHTTMASFEVVEPEPPTEIVIVDTYGGPVTGGNFGTTDTPAIAQSFVSPAISGSLSVSVDLATGGALPTDGIVMTLHPDAGGAPDETVTLATSNTVSGGMLPILSDGYAMITFILDGIDLSEGTYWVVLNRTGSVDDNQHYVASVREDDPYASGGWSILTGDAWLALSWIDMTIKVVSP